MVYKPSDIKVNLFDISYRVLTHEEWFRIDLNDSKCSDMDAYILRGLDGDSFNPNNIRVLEGTEYLGSFISLEELNKEVSKICDRYGVISSNLIIQSSDDSTCIEIGISIDTKTNEEYLTSLCLEHFEMVKALPMPTTHMFNGREYETYREAVKAKESLNLEIEEV